MKIFIVVIIILIFLVIGFLICAYFGSRTGLYGMVNEDGKKVFFLGVPHIGTQKYWKEINRNLDYFPGKIFYEGVPIGCKLTEIMRPFMKIAKYTETTYQDAVINIWSSTADFVLADLTMDEIREFYSEKQIKALNDQAELFNIKPVWLSRLLFCAGAFYAYNIENDPLVYRRNVRPVKYVLDSKSSMNLIFYGQAHWRGIKKDLQAHGFRLCSTEYFYPFK